MSKIRLVSFITLVSVINAVPALAQDALDTDAKIAGYSIGANIGVNLEAQGLMEDLDLESLIAGIRDSIGGEMKLTENEIMAALQSFSMMQQAKMEAAVNSVNNEFLGTNGARAGVMTTASGLQYEVMTAATDGAAAMPAVTDTVNVHYHGTLVDGSVFDSSVERGEPITFPLDGVIPGWTEGLQLMKVGDKFRFWIPPALGYGPQDVGPIPGNSILIFDVELLGIEAAE